MVVGRAAGLWILMSPFWRLEFWSGFYNFGKFVYHCPRRRLVFPCSLRPWGLLTIFFRSLSFFVCFLHTCTSLKPWSAWWEVLTWYSNQFKGINQQDAAASQVYYLSFQYSSTCFGHPPAHHQELQQLQQQPLVYRWNAVVAVLLVVVGPAGPTMTNSTAITKLQR